MTTKIAPPASGSNTAQQRLEARRRRERRWRDLTRLQRDLARLIIERMTHGILERDSVDDLLDTVEGELAREFPRRWAAAQPDRLAESAGWWHTGAHIDRDGLPAVLGCEHCHVLGGGLSHWLQLPA